MKTQTRIKIGLMVLLILGVAMGVLGDEVYRCYSNDRTYDGLRFVANDSHPAALEKARTYDNYADWVCVNVRGMDYNRAVEVCQHEVGHEIFAEVCEKNMTKCLDVVSLNGTKK
jgi:hypothetical protein